MEHKAETDYLFEASWEVCNKVGGIFTVVKSKAYIMKEYYKNYFLIGPYFEKNLKTQFTEQDAPEFLKKAFSELKNEGINCHFGTWDIDGSPNTILIDFNGLLEKKNDIKKKLWEWHGIDSMNSKWDFEEPMVWSWAVGMLLCQIKTHLPNKKIVGHFHEWLAGFTIFYLKQCNSGIKTVFTTHATMLGRTIAGSGEDLYGRLEEINPDERAYFYKVQDKYLTEKASAQTADIFTTVSEITAIEATKILGRKPEVILNNGLTIRKFPTIEETSMKHLITREKIREFIVSHFFPHYNMDLEHNLIFFIVGRYEYKNKGLDVLIKALAKLNNRLKQEKSPRTVTTFFWIPMDVHGVKVEVLENKNSFRHIKNYVQWNSNEILKKMIMEVVSWKTPTAKTMLTQEFIKHLEGDIVKFKREGNPQVLTHNISNENSDPIMNELKNNGLDNHEDDNVKTIVYPVYLDGNDGLINLPYYDAISGSHLGIFPSYYEPWGYTPLETAALGVASLTTDLAGFGRFIESKIDSKEKTKGIYVLKRFNRTEEQVVNDLFKMLYDFTSMTHEERVKNKVVAKNLASYADWKEFVGNYIKAHNLALKK